MQLRLIYIWHVSVHHVPHKGCTVHHKDCIVHRSAVLSIPISAHQHRETRQPFRCVIHFYVQPCQLCSSRNPALRSDFITVQATRSLHCVALNMGHNTLDFCETLD